MIYHKYKPCWSKGEVEGGELLAVVNKRSTAALNRLSDINVAGGGRRFAQGGIVGGPSGFVSSWCIPRPASVPSYQGEI